MDDLCTIGPVGIPGNACILARVLRGNSGVRDLFLVFIPEAYEVEMDTGMVMTYFESCFLRWDEIALISRIRGPCRQTLRVLRNKLLVPPSFRARGTILGMVPFLADRRPPAEPATSVWTPRFRDEAIARRVGRGAFRPTGVVSAYLAVLLERARSAGVRTHLVTAAMPAEVVEAWRRSGRLRQYEEFLEGIRRDWPEVTVLPADLFADFPGNCFWDQVHLQPLPLERYGSRLSAALLSARGR